MISDYSDNLKLSELLILGLACLMFSVLMFNVLKAISAFCVFIV